MAREGRKFTSFYSASSVCTPSRAALLTGSYPKRVGLAKGVIFPQDDKGLHPDEVTIAKLSGADFQPRGPIDGLKLSALVHGKGPSPRNEFLYYGRNGVLEGLRVGDWKLRITKKDGIRPRGEI